MSERVLPGKLLICVPFFFVETRLEYLKESLEDAPLFGEQVHLVVVTNAIKYLDRKLIESAVPDGFASVKIITPTYLGHSYFLTWSHFDVFRENLEGTFPADYFMYREDDLKITRENIQYWLEHSINLQGTPFTPAFLRFEFNPKSHDKVLTDITKRAYLRRLPNIRVADSNLYISLEHNYQGWYLLTRENTEIHLNGISSNPDFGLWKIREKATQGLNLIGVPSGFYSRNLIAVDLIRGDLDSRCLVRHLPNNYAADPASPFGKIQVQKLLIRRFRFKNEIAFLIKKFRSQLGSLLRKYR